jgi:hypothetical protein
MEQAKADALAMGVILIMPDPEPYEVWPECEQSLEVFLSMNTQWRVEGMSGTVMGLDYPALATVMDMLGVEDRRQTFADCRAMEAEALKIDRERAR